MTRKSTPMTAMTTTSSGTLNPEFFTDLPACAAARNSSPPPVLRVTRQGPRAKSTISATESLRHEAAADQRINELQSSAWAPYGLADRSSGRRLVGGSGRANRYFLQRGVLIRLQIVVLAAAAKRLVNYTLRQFPLCSKA